MKKNIKFLLISILILTTFAGGVSFPYSAQADSSEKDLNTEQQIELRKGILSWYGSKGYKHYPFQGKAINSCPYEPGKEFPSCICSGTEELKRCWNWICLPEKDCETPDIEGKSKITKYLDDLTTYEDFAKEHTYILYIENLGLGPAAETGLIDSIGAYLHNLNTDKETDLKEGFDYYIDRNEKVTAMNFPDQTQTDDCLYDYATLAAWEILSPGRLIRGFFAAIAMGARGILGFIANAVVKSFTVLPQKIGGYVHFDVISNPDTGIWKMMQIYANFGIIIMMIFMAIATILGIEKYSYKKMLWKLLLVALLINFSLIICGMLVDISNFLSYHFLSNSTSGNLGNTMEGVVTNTSCAIAGPDKSDFLPTMVGVSVAIVLSFVFLFQFAGLLLFIVSRIITIWICLATSPLAFLGMAIDAEPVKKAVTMWRDRFTQALVALPILSFTLYFVLIILSKIAIQINGISGNNELDLVMLVAYSVIVIALAQVLRVVAKSIGVEQIEQGYAFAQKAIKGIAMAGAAAVGGAALAGIQKSGAYAKVGQKLTQLPMLSGTGYGMLRQHTKATQFANIKKREKDLEGRDKAEIMALAGGKAPSMSNKEAYADYAAARNTAIKRGWLHGDALKNIDINDPTINKKDLVTAAPEEFRFGKDGELQRIDPANYTKDVIEGLQKLDEKDLGKTKHKERIYNQIEAQARAQARSRNENEDDAAKKAFDEFNQQLVIKLRGGQLAAFYNSIDDEEWTNKNYKRRIKKGVMENEESREAFDEKLANDSFRKTFEMKREESLKKEKEQEKSGTTKIGFRP